MRWTIVDKIYVFIMVLSLLAVVVIGVYLHRGPYREFLDSKRRLAEANRELQMIKKMREEQERSLQTQEKLMGYVERRPGGFDLFSYISGVLRECKLSDKAKLDNYRSRSASPRQPMVQVRLEGISLKRFVEFLKKIYLDSYLVSVYKIDKLRP
ncbi:MAG: hypothetical protein N3G21_01370, partial [Candidatus Hydrogenedentes bacterium]|nr:hypothetical protein [Candidatus Hydrogenedentota bacterium]